MMKKILLNILVFSILFFAFDKLFIYLRSAAAERQVDKRLEVVINGKMDADLLIFGSSIGAQGIIASSLSKELNIKAYNLSFPGSNVDFHEYLLNQVLINGNKKPKLVLLNVDEPAELIANTSINFRLDRLYPLVKYESIRDELNKREGKNKWFSQFLILYQLNKSNLDLRQKKFNTYDTILPCGSMPSYLTTNNFPSNYPSQALKYNIKDESPYLIKKFQSFINLCAKHHIKLVIVYPPKYRPRNKTFEERIQFLAGNKALHLMYNDQDSLYRDKINYIDASHLRTNGAHLFTKEVAIYLKAQQLF
jgi:hypothetical protein